MLAASASTEGKLEALHMINENYWEVYQALRDLKRGFLQSHPEYVDDNVPEVNGAGENARSEDPPGENATGSSEAMADWGCLITTWGIEDFLWFLMIFFDF